MTAQIRGRIDTEAKEWTVIAYHHYSAVWVFVNWIEEHQSWIVFRKPSDCRCLIQSLGIIVVAPMKIAIGMAAQAEMSIELVYHRVWDKFVRAENKQAAYGLWGSYPRDFRAVPVKDLHFYGLLLP